MEHLLSPKDYGGKRLSARVGRDFQVKVPKFGASKGLSLRPAPIQMSLDHPHLTLEEETTGGRGEMGRGVSLLETDHEATTIPEKLIDTQTAPPRRGGECVHRRSDDKSSPAKFVQSSARLMFPTEPEPASAYFQKMIASSTQTSNLMGTSRISGRTKKRKTPHQQQPEEINWSKSLRICGEESSSNRQADSLREEDAAALLEYLQSAHEGNTQAAELSVRVKLSNGTACKARRLNMKKTAKGGRNWRRQVARSQTGMLGDLRSDTAIVAYPQSDQDDSLNPESDIIFSDPIGLWRSTLECCQFIETHLEEEPSDNKLRLRDVLKFIQASSGLPSPEESFGTRHVSVERLAESFTHILEQINKTRCTQAELIDLLADTPIDIEETEFWLSEAERTSSVSLGNDINIVRQLLARTVELQSSLNSTRADNTSIDDVDSARKVAAEVSQVGLRSREMADLESRLEKHKDIERRLREWDDTGKTGTLKMFAAFEREVKRLNLVSPRTQKFLDLSRSIDDWVDRAQIAVRSRMALSEIVLLIEKAKELPLNLSEYLDKLQLRVTQAHVWIERLKSIIPAAIGDEDQIVWSQQMRKVLLDESADRHGLLDLACEGSRIPVEIDFLIMLQVEIDAKNWIIKGRKWIPNPGMKAVKGRIEDLREHLRKATMLRERLPAEIKEKWILEHEKELQKTVSEADCWMEEFQKLLDPERGSETSAPVSIAALRKLVSSGESINASIGNQVAKLNRILDQAETWCRNHATVLSRAANPGTGLLSFQELLNAVNESSIVSVDLTEVQLLRDVLERIQAWLERCAVAAPIKRSKRSGGKWASKVVRFSVREMIELINEASTLPIDSSDEVARLKSQLEGVHKWRISAQEDIVGIVSGVIDLKTQMMTAYKLRDENGRPSYNPIESTISKEDATMTESNQKQVTGNNATEDDAKPEGADESISDYELVSSSLNELQSTISTLTEEASQLVVVSSEEEIVSRINDVLEWCVKSHETLEHPMELFAAKKHQKFDSFVDSGHQLLEDPAITDETDVDLKTELFHSVNTLIQDQLNRLAQVRQHRDDFIEWSKSASSALDAKEKSLTTETIERLVKESQLYPPKTDIVRKIEKLSRQVSNWKASVMQVIRQTGEKLTFEKAQQLCKEADAMKLSCDELKELRSAIRSAKGWLSRIKKCKVEQGLASTSEMEELIEEHGDLLVTLPDDLEKVREGLKGYCVCRRPYEGFMIGCDGCDEWYHGICIGLTKSQADRCERYLCIRCCVKASFTQSAGTLASVVRKWTSEKELKKTRLAEQQKHQRKVRKEKKDKEKFLTQVAELHQQLNLETGATEPCEISNAPTEAPDDEGAVVENKDGPDIEMEAERKPMTVVSDGKTDAVSEGVGPDLNKDAGQSKETVAATKATSTPECSTVNQELKTKLQKLLRAIEVCSCRLVQLENEAVEREASHRKHYERRELLKIWSIRLRASVLVPSNDDLANYSCPSPAGDLSVPMLNLFEDADKLQIAKLPDVHLVANSLKSIAWSAQAMTTLSRKPTLGQVQALITLSTSIQLPDEKAIKMMKAMVHRTSQWQVKVRKALTAKPGDKKPVPLGALDDLQELSSELPCDIAETNFLSNTIEDKGRRHCMCGGTNVLGYEEMISCEKCKIWFHSTCVETGTIIQQPDSIGEWMCPSCSGEDDTRTDRYYALFDSEPVKQNLEAESAPEAPTIDKLWPPFGLFGSDKSREVLGDDCLMIPDKAGQVLVPPNTRPEQAAVFLQQLLAQSKGSESTLVAVQSQQSTAPYSAAIHSTAPVVSSQSMSNKLGAHPEGSTKIETVAALPSIQERSSHPPSSVRPINQVSRVSVSMDLTQDSVGCSNNDQNNVSEHVTPTQVIYKEEADSTGRLPKIDQHIMEGSESKDGQEGVQLDMSEGDANQIASLEGKES